MKRAGFLLVGVLAACSQAPDAAGPPFQDRLLATMPNGIDVFVPPAFAPNGRSVAYILRTKEGDWAVREGWKSCRYDTI